MKPLLRVLYWLPLGIALTRYGYTIKTVRGRSMQVRAPTRSRSHPPPFPASPRSTQTPPHHPTSFSLTDSLSTLASPSKKATSSPSGAPFSPADVSANIPPRDPVDSRKMIVKRVVAVADDTVQTLPPYPDTEVRIPEGHIWVEGDEPFRTLDSNSFGPVRRLTSPHRPSNFFTRSLSGWWTRN